MNLSILYRGPLASCNYGCEYCPFAKHQESAAEHAADGVALNRFLEWLETRTTDRLSIFFTPWGEALIRKRYQAAMVRLSHLPQIAKVAIQTNLSGPLGWIDRAERSRLGIWATYHPGETSRSRFLGKCRELDRRSVRYSVGVVGLKEHLAEIEALRHALPAHVYLWVNAYKRQPDYYSQAELEFLETIDPLFPLNNQYHNSFGRACRAGHSVISVDGTGTMRRCHFIPEPIGNLYQSDFAAGLRERPCPNATCGCHIGYVHLDELKLYDVFGTGVLERVPEIQPFRAEGKTL
ncbi:MAG: STM4011 family radical SAM protein [Blastocatellia bacterium]|nr:STM4011 family radical SAM protein [Blastocatellia bacterium]